MKILFVIHPFPLCAVFCLTWSVLSCSGSLPADTENGVKHINGLKIQARLLSADRAIKPEIEISNHGKDVNPDNITILLAISPDKTGGTTHDIAWKGISGFDEYKQRIRYLNFQIQEDVSLRIGEKKFKPVLSHLESGHELTHGRNVLFVFSPFESEDIEIFRTARLLDLRYEDHVFGTGISHFRLVRDDFNN